MAMWVVIFIDRNDPQFNKCSPPMSKKCAQSYFDTFCDKEGHLAQIIKTRRGSKLV